MPKSNHIHRYKKVNLSRTKGEEYLVYKCTKPLCSHYMPLTIAEGQMCECNRCGEPMIITKETLRWSHGGPMARPHCTTCVKRKNTQKETVDALSEFLNKKGA